MKGEVGSLVEEMGNAAFENSSPGNSDSCKITLGFHTRRGYKHPIPQWCLNLHPPLLLFHAKQEWIAKLLSKEKKKTPTISVTFLDSDNGVYGEFLSSVHFFLNQKSSFKMLATSSTFTWAIHSLIQETPRGADTAISLQLLLSQAIVIPRTPSSEKHLCHSPSFLFQYEELPLILMEVNICTHRTQ